jgi:hypothetical protein
MLAARWRMRRRLLGAASSGELPLAQGLWMVTPSGAVRYGTRVPEGLQPRLTRHVSAATPTRKRVHRRLDIPFTTPSATASDHGEVLIPVSHGGLMVVSLRRSLAHRLHGGAGMTREYREVRRTLDASLPAPRWSLHPSDGAVEEFEWLEGPNLSSVTSAERFDATAASIIERLQRLSESHAAGDARSFLDNVLLHATRLDLPPSLTTALENPQARAALATGRLVPAHGDLHPENVLLTATGPQVIDFTPETIGRHPWWFDALTLVLHPYGGLRSGGVAEAALIRLFAANGSEWPEAPAAQESLKAFTAVATAIIHTRWLRDSDERRRAQSRTLAIWWEASNTRQRA